MAEITPHLVVLVALACLSVCSCSVILKPSVGVAFIEQLKTLRPWTGSQSLSFVVKMPRLKKFDEMRLPTPSCSQAGSIFNDLCLEGNKEMKILLDISNELIENINTELANVKKILKTLKASTINKRSLINAGQFFQNLVGTASMDTVNELYKKLKEVHADVLDAATDRQSLFDALNNMQDSDLAKFNTVFHLIDDTNQFLTSTVRNLTATNLKLDTIYDALVNPGSFAQLHQMHLQHAAILSKHGYLRDLMRIYREFHKDIYVLMAGKLPVSMVPAADLISGLSKLRNTALKDSSKLIPLDNPASLHLYYQGATFTHANVFDDSIVISVEVPFVTKDKVYDAYKVIVMQIPVHSNTQNAQTAFSILANTHDYLVVDKARETYKLMSSSEYNECTHYTFGLCKILTVSRPRLKQSCLWSIYKDDEANIIELCNFRTHLQTQMEPGILPIDPNQYLVSNVVGVISLSCDNGIHYLTASNFSLITTTCNCIWNTNDFVISPRIGECNNKLAKPTVSHPVSFPIMHAFNLTKHLSVPRTVVLANDTPTVPIPNLDSLGLKVNSYMKAHGVSTSEIPKMLDKVKLHKVNPWADVTLTSYSQSQTWFLTGLAVWNTILSIVVIILCCRFRTVLPLLVSAPNGATAFNIPTTPISPMETQMLGNNELVTIVCVLLSLAAVLMLIHRLLGLTDTCCWRINKLHRRFPSCVKPDTLNQNISLYARINIESKNQVVFLTTLGFSPEMSFKSVPTCLSYGLYVDYCTPKLVLEWDGHLVLQHKREAQVHLPTCVSITWTLYNQIAGVIKNTTALDPTELSLIYQAKCGPYFYLVTPASIASAPSERNTEEAMSLPDVMEPNAHLL